MPALVTVGRSDACRSERDPHPGALLPAPAPARGKTVWTITPSAIPKGIELSIGYYHVTAGFGIHVTLVPDHTALTCTASPPTPPHP